jgi:hypothetical protein
MTYEFRRPSELRGVGPFEVYRAVKEEARDAQMWQEPRFFVRQQWAFNRLLTSRDPELAALMYGNDAHPAQTSIPKLWTEAAYETKRLELDSTVPSRLDSLFACADPLDAFLLVDVTPIGSVWRGTVEDGAGWVIVDMAEFATVTPASATTGAFEDAWREATLRAEAYWTPSSSHTKPEVLVAGAINLTEQVFLRSLLDINELG